MKKKYISAVAILGCLLSINVDSFAAKKVSSKIIPKHKVESPQDVRIVTNKNTQVSRKELPKAPANSNSPAKATVKPADLVIKDGKTYFRGAQIPNDFKEIKIMGEPVVTKHQAYTYLKQKNPNARLDCSIEDIVDVYWIEAGREGVRPDLAFCQALLETGFFRFGGDVLPMQNNFCGLGTVGGGAKGVRFKTPQEGARAHVQHLLAYSRSSVPQTSVIDPRYKLVHNIRMERGLIEKWYGLNGTWAMGGNYCEKIMTIYQNMLALPPGDKKDNKIKIKKSKLAEMETEGKNSSQIRDRVWDIIKDKK